MANPDTQALITASRAVQIPQLSAAFAANPNYVASLIAAASSLVQKHCHRDFVSQSYTEYRNGYAQNWSMSLRQYPITSITRFGIAVPALQVLNSGTVYQRATVQSTPTGLTLWAIASGTPTTTFLPYATYPTVQATSNAIIALGNGWSTAIMSGSFGSFANWPSSDFKPDQGAFTALIGGGWLDIYEDFQAGTSGGTWGDDGDYGTSGLGYNGWRLDADSGIMTGRFTRSPLSMRIDYTAGYTTIPYDIQEATAQLVLFLFQKAQQDLTVSSEHLGDWSSSYVASQGIPPHVTAMLSRHVAHDRVISW